MCSVCKADLNTVVVREGEREESEGECAPHTPLMTCSVKVVDCRTMKLITSNPDKKKDKDGELDNEDVIPSSVSFTNTNTYTSEVFRRVGCLQNSSTVSVTFINQSN